jgi:hypothetical protein
MMAEKVVKNRMEEQAEMDVEKMVEMLHRMADRYKMLAKRLTDRGGRPLDIAERKMLRSAILPHIAEVFEQAQFYFWIGESDMLAESCYIVKKLYEDITLG